MPPQLKCKQKKVNGGRVILYNRYTQDRGRDRTKLAQEVRLTNTTLRSSPRYCRSRHRSKELLEEVGELDMLSVPLGEVLLGSLLSTKSSFRHIVEFLC